MPGFVYVPVGSGDAPDGTPILEAYYKNADGQYFRVVHLDAVISATLAAAVDQGNAGTHPWLVTDTALEALISGGKLAVSDATLEALVASGALKVVDASGKTFSDVITAVTGTEGGKTLADVYNELVTIAGAKALSDIVTSLGTLLTQAQLEAELDEKFPDVGQKAMSASSSVVIASDQSAVPTTAVTQAQLEAELDEKFGDVGQRAMAASTPVVIASDQSVIPVKNPAKVAVSVEITRPSDTTAYAALDVVDVSTSAPTGLTFTNVVATAGDSGYIVGARLVTDQKTNTARFRLHLYRTAPTYINDNSPFLTLYTNKTNSIGPIDFPAAITEDATNSTSAYTRNIVDKLPFVTSGSTSLFGILETLDAFTPANGQKITVELLIARDA